MIRKRSCRFCDRLLQGTAQRLAVRSELLLNVVALRFQKIREFLSGLSQRGHALGQQSVDPDRVFGNLCRHFIPMATHGVFERRQAFRKRGAHALALPAYTACGRFRRLRQFLLEIGKAGGNQSAGAFFPFQQRGCNRIALLGDGLFK